MISKKKQKGVTLISLVITIIILIILASISIKVLLGEDGLITKAKEAKKAQKISEIKERISLEITSAKAEAILRNEELEKAQVKDIIEPKYGTLKEDGETIVTKEGNYEISLQEIYYGALSESGSYSAKVEQVEMLEKQLADLKEQYKTLEETNSGNTKQLEDLNNKIIELENTKQTLEGELETKKQELQTAQTNLENKNKELETKKAELAQKEIEFENQKQNLENQLKTAQANLKSKETENTELKSTVESLQTEKEKLQQKVSELETLNRENIESITDNFSIMTGAYAGGYGAQGSSNITYDVTNFKNVTITAKRGTAEPSVATIKVDNVNKYTYSSNSDFTVTFDVTNNKNVTIDLRYSNSEGYQYLIGSIKRSK